LCFPIKAGAYEHRRLKLTIWSFSTRSGVLETKLVKGTNLILFSLKLKAPHAWGYLFYNRLHSYMTEKIGNAKYETLAL